MFVYTIVTTILKLGGGLAMALVMDQTFRGRNLARAFLLLPFIVPTALSTIAWMWIFDPTFSVSTGSSSTAAPSAAASPGWATRRWPWWSIIIVNTWRGMPFYGITLLAGLQTISPELYEAAAIDGATTRQRFWYVTMPLIKPVLVIVTMFSVIFTFSDFQLIYALTHGGPANATQVFVDLRVRPRHERRASSGMGAAVALSMLPALALADRRAHPLPEAGVGDGRRARPRDADAPALPAAEPVLVILMLFPFYWMLITSIKPNRELYSQRSCR